MKKYNKTYGTVAEMHRRFRIFRRNMLKVDHLQATERGTAKYGPTFFADLTGSKDIIEKVIVILCIQRKSFGPDTWV